METNETGKADMRQHIDTKEKLARNARQMWSLWRPLGVASKRLVEELEAFSLGTGPNTLEEHRQQLFTNPGLGQDYVGLLSMLLGWDDFDGQLDSTLDYMRRADSEWENKCNALTF